MPIATKPEQRQRQPTITHERVESRAFRLGVGCIDVELMGGVWWLGQRSEQVALEHGVASSGASEWQIELIEQEDRGFAEIDLWC